MDTSQKNFVAVPEKMRSPFSVDVLEIVVAIIVVLVTWFELHSFLQSALPYPCGDAINNVPIDCGWTEEEAWQALGKPLFIKYVIPFTIFNTLAAGFLIRAIRRDVDGFSRLGSIAPAWPLLSLLGIQVLYCVWILPIGFMIALRERLISA